MDGRGFSLVEMSIALAVLAALAAATAPGLGDYLRDCRRTATVNALLDAIHSARRMAGLYGRPVELCPTRNGQDCSGGFLWDGDLLLRPVAEGGPPPRVLPAPARPPAQSLQANRAALTFSPLRPSATTATLTLCDDRGAPDAVAVIVSRSGRPRISRQDAGGGTLRCP